ncbi:hypothetical protein QFZ81_003881 [Paenibacillus sp. V4I9]|uniref:hypothetical protein n=1 Tax=Paenibacillus sp. V4I9 TaxID=3042308 RepID=UPI002787C216|nr:hypothetical protein [Paenibacillus sp. V4I9]MDQ0888793.1 hypothetical protein [Paenibacillus sp. V4I9]
MSKFELVFKPESEHDIVMWFKEGDVDYSFWGGLDILIDGQSFFKKYTHKGLSIPLIPMIEAIAEVLSILKEEQTAIIEEYTGQISNTIVCVLDEKGENVTFAIRNDFEAGKEPRWYDGQEVSYSKEIPVSLNNIVNYEDFVIGCVESIRNFLLSLVEKNPQLKDVSQFSTWSKILLTKLMVH